jgi:rRNA maturation protein Nop10
MTDLKIDEKDKVVIRKNHKTGEYEVKEVVLHDVETADLLKRAYKILGDLKAGKLPMIIAEVEGGTLKYKCDVCGLTQINSFNDMPDRNRLPCPRCAVWTWHNKVKV